ncbi:MAG TPA: phytanoyl-CoA dioxygenase family protein, partial [Bacilli bacterium]
IAMKWGLMDETRDFMEGKVQIEEVYKLDIGSAGVGVPDALYLEIQKLEVFHEIAHDPVILNIMFLLFEQEAFPHPRNICRILLPHPQLRPTPPHQDFLHIQGTPVTWTCWFPLGDCPVELGGLAILEGSHQQGVFQVTGHEGAGGLESILCELNLEWATDHYEPGDIIVFHSHTVHKALPNQRRDYIRLSCDFRYQPADQVIDPSSLKPHGTYTWEEIYEGWTNQELQYYWKPKEFVFSVWDESIRWQREKIC